MSLIKNDRLLRALLCEPVDTTPVWIMRQAGRYLPEYRALREKAGDFLSLCMNPELACEVTLQPLERFDLDAAILFSDILTIPHAMGLGLHFVEGEGPKFSKRLTTAKDIAALPIPNPDEDLHYVLQAIQNTQEVLNGKVPLIGFSGSPWTLATYMVEGGASTQFKAIKGLLYSDPATLHTLLHKLSLSVAQYLNAQIAAGVNAVMIFDTWGGILPTPHFHEFSLRYIKEVIQSLYRTWDHQRIPVIVFTKGGGLWLESLAQSGCNALGLDWTISLSAARARVPEHIALQGNLDPSALYGSDAGLVKEVTQILNSYGPQAGHVFNLGHGIAQDVDPSKVALLVDTVHTVSHHLHSSISVS